MIQGWFLNGEIALSSRLERCTRTHAANQGTTSIEVRRESPHARSEFLLSAEFRGETHPARASIARAPGGITVGPEQGELAADFTVLGIGGL